MKSELPASDRSSIAQTVPPSTLPETAAPSLQELPTPRKHIARSIFSFGCTVLLLAAFVVVGLHRDEIVDWAKTRNYQPPSAIQQMANDTTMTAYARRLLYVNHPAVEDKAAFNQHCPDASKEAAVLGCFRGNRLGIYIYDVTDPRLAGIQQVTAAHEMLHQAYERLNTSERTRINALLRDYAKTITDQDLKDRLDVYRKSEPNDMDTEMHSLFGTEVATLPAALEAYYKQYFTDRQKVVTFHAQYRSAFIARTTQIEAYDQRIASLKPQIDAELQDLAAREASLKSRRQQMDAYLADNNAAAYNALVAPFNADVATYQQLLTHVNTLIDQYNAAIDARNKLSVEEQDLLRAQNSHASSVTQQ